MFDGRGDTGWVDVSNTLGSGAVQYRINAAGVCSVSVVATYSTTSGMNYTICTLPEGGVERLPRRTRPRQGARRSAG